MNATDQKELERIEAIARLRNLPIPDALWLISQLRAAQQTIAQKDGEIRQLRGYFEHIIREQPCTEGGGCFYPMCDGEGNPIGEQNVDPLGVIQSMVVTAQEALSTPSVAVVPKLTECDCCHDEFATDDLELTGTQFLCAKCKKGNQ